MGVDEQVTDQEHLQASQISRGSPGGQQVSVSEETSMTGALSQPAAGALPPLLPPSMGEAQHLRLCDVFHHETCEALRFSSGNRGRGPSTSSLLPQPAAPPLN